MTADFDHCSAGIFSKFHITQQQNQTSSNFFYGKFHEYILFLNVITTTFILKVRKGELYFWFRAFYFE